MALNTQMANATVNAQASALATLCNSGFIKLYDGTQPADADTAITTQVLGATLTMGATAFGAPANGVLTANAITGAAAVASITPTWARIYKSDGTTAVMDVSAGASGANLTVGAFTSGTTVNCTSFVHTVAKATAGL
ncbi:MAG: hypothetical protein ACYC36_02325 [Bellilinea sp.]